MQTIMYELIPRSEILWLGPQAKSNAYFLNQPNSGLHSHEEVKLYDRENGTPNSYIYSLFLSAYSLM